MTEEEFSKLVTRVLGSSTPRVWSLLVTMFGDLALAPQARLNGATVNALTAAIGIKPEATRVALHRLRKDDWIESHRIGRQTRYGLTPHGRAETKSAAPRVYGPAPDGIQAFLVMENPAESSDWLASQTATTTVQIGPKTAITTATSTRSHHLRIALESGRDLPVWLTDKLCPPALQAASRDLARRFAQILDHPAIDDLDLLQRTAVRMVVVHEWRRLILRTPAFPETLMPDGWRGSECRRACHTLLNRLAVPDLTALEDAIETG